MRDNGMTFVHLRLWSHHMPSIAWHSGAFVREFPFCSSHQNSTTCTSLCIPHPMISAVLDMMTSVLPCVHTHTQATVGKTQVGHASRD